MRTTYSAEAVLYNGNNGVGRVGERGAIQTGCRCRTANERTSVDPVITLLTVSELRCSMGLILTIEKRVAWYSVLWHLVRKATWTNNPQNIEMD
jgi:hypothetical protein